MDEKIKKLGGKVISEPKKLDAHGKHCVIEDPAGAVCALILHLNWKQVQSIL